MPEISSATPLVATAPAAPVSTAPAGPALAPGPVAQDFLGQLKAALKTLASVVTAPPTASQGGPAAAAPTGVTEPVDIAATPVEAKPADKTLDAALPEILVALGVVTAPHTPMPAPQLVTAEPASKPLMTTTDGAPLATPLTQAPSTAPLTSEIATQPSTPVEAHTLPQEVQLPKDAHAPVQPETPAVTPSTSTTPVSDSAPVLNAPVVPHDVHQLQPLTTSATPVATPAPTSVVHVQPQTAGGGFHQEQNSGNSGKQHASSVAVSDLTETTATPSTTVVDQTMASATAASAASNPAQPSMEVHPADVVSQIAHQADLYRLPGNKGVRINLHPDDLGGVQVTLRYATGGSLELHINVEHATTGALVEAGWTQLRDALATQGIEPERLVMSVTGPAGSSQLDFSSNGGGSYRSDPGLSAFTQGGDSGNQQRQDNSGADTGSRPSGWSSSSDTNAASDDKARTANVASASRIDYRV